MLTFYRGAGLGAAGLAGGAALASHPKSVEDAHVPGSFPETPFNESQQFSVNPIPATAGASNPVTLAPGEKVPEPSTYTNNTISSNARDDPELRSAAGGEQTFGVAPIPATGGAGNPISLAPGEKVPEPSSYTGNSLKSNVRLDKESYEKSDAGAPVLPPVLSKQEEAEANGASMFGLPAVGGTMIPESSLPMGSSAFGSKSTDPLISSAAPQSTSAQLAGQQPIEPRGVPEVVSESQSAAHFSPEASAVPTAVAEKSQLEQELKEKVPEAPSTSESGVVGKSEKGYTGMAAGGLAAAGAAAAGLAYATKDKVAPSATSSATEQGLSPNDVRGPSAPAPSSALSDKAAITDEIKDTVPTAPTTSESGMLGKSEKGFAGILPPSVASAINNMNTGISNQIGTSNQTLRETATTETVPAVVKESQKEAHVGPEASASPVAVQEKSAVEKELLKEIKPTNATGTPAPTASAATATTAPVKSTTSGAPVKPTAPAGVVSKDTKDPFSSPSSGGLNAPASSAAMTPATASTAATATSLKPSQPSRDVSPMSHPVATTGTQSSAIPTKTEAAPSPNVSTGPSSAISTPQKARPASQMMKDSPASQNTGAANSPAASDATKKRKSFFGKLKDKLKG